VNTMTPERMLEVLDGWDMRPSSLFCDDPFMFWNGPGEYVCLDDNFSLEQLEAIALYMSLHGG
jgi:hypothetical protein